MKYEFGHGIKQLSMDAACSCKSIVKLFHTLFALSSQLFRIIWRNATPRTIIWVICSQLFKCITLFSQFSSTRRHAFSDWSINPCQGKCTSSAYHLYLKIFLFTKVPLSYGKILYVFQSNMLYLMQIIAPGLRKCIPNGSHKIYSMSGNVLILMFSWKTLLANRYFLFSFLIDRHLCC